MARSDADLVVAGGLAPGHVVGPPRLVFPHGALGDPGHWLLTLPALRTCDTLALASSSDAAIVDRMAGTPFCARADLPLFVDTEFFSPDPTERRATRGAHGIADGTPLLLAVSSFDPQKNLQSAISLCAALRRSHPGTALAIAGDGTASERAALDRCVREHDLEGTVHFLGLRSPAELCALYRAADLLVHLTLQRKESFGLVPVEAQACGLPVLASAWGGVRDTVLPGETGFYASVKLTAEARSVDWRALCEPARTLLDDPGLRSSFGVRGAVVGAVALFDRRVRDAGPRRHRCLVGVGAAGARSTFPCRSHPRASRFWLPSPTSPFVTRVRTSRQLSDRLAETEVGRSARHILFRLHGRGGGAGRTRISVSSRLRRHRRVDPATHVSGLDPTSEPTRKSGCLGP